MNLEKYNNLPVKTSETFWKPKFKELTDSIPKSVNSLESFEDWLRANTSMHEKELQGYVGMAYHNNTFSKPITKEELASRFKRVFLRLDGKFALAPLLETFSQDEMNKVVIPETKIELNEVLDNGFEIDYKNADSDFEEYLITRSVMSINK